MRVFAGLRCSHLGDRRGAGRAHRTFATPEEAVKTLVDIVKKGDLDALLAMFGTDGKELIASSDPATARQNRQVFAVAAREQWHLEDAAPNRKTLVIGNEEWPFPVPLVKERQRMAVRHRGGQGRSAGAADRTQRAVGDRDHPRLCHRAAALRAAGTRRQAAAGVYAAKFRSDPGKENGLYWPTGRGQKRSPLGDLVAQAAAEGRPVGGDQPQPTGVPWLLLQDPDRARERRAAGGARSYVVKGEMSGGFALVAWPAQYDVTGVMTFVVNQDGSVRQKDLGPETDAAARKMTTYNPDASWQEVQ